MKDSDFTLAWSFKNRKDVLFRSIETADRTCPKSIDFCLVDAASTDDTIKSLRDFCNKIENRTIRICESTYRSSLTEAWNLCMMLTNRRYVIYASSDVYFQMSGWIEAIRAGLSKSPYVLLNNHAVFCVDKAIVPKIGWWDESYKAGPHFDPDYMIRASEAGINYINVGNPGFYIHGDEGDKKVDKVRAQQEVADRLPMHEFHNEKYFKSKWESSWVGWKEAIAKGSTHKPHPPVHISQVTRKKPEIDPHPIYTNKYKERKKWLNYQ